MLQADALPSEPSGKPTMEPQEKVNRKGGSTSLAVQWLRIHVSTAGRTCSTPGQGIKSCVLCSVAKKKKKRGWRHSL